MNNLEELKEKKSELLEAHGALIENQTWELVQSIELYLETYVLDKEAKKHFNKVLKVLKENRE